MFQDVLSLITVCLSLLVFFVKLEQMAKMNDRVPKEKVVG